MSIALVIDPAGIRIEDTTDGIAKGPPLVASLTVTEHIPWSKISVPSGTETTIPFGSVAAAKALMIRTSVATTVKVNGESTGHAVNPILLILDSAGGLTSATVTQSSGSAVVMDYLVAG